MPVLVAAADKFSTRAATGAPVPGVAAGSALGADSRTGKREGPDRSGPSRGNEFGGVDQNWVPSGHWMNVPLE